MTKKKMIWAGVGSVAFLGVLALAFRACYFKGVFKGENDLGSFSQAITLAALTMHREHFHQSPDTYNLLVWRAPEAEVSGVTFHEVYPWRFGLTKESSAQMTYLLEENYDRIAVMRACSDVLDNKCTPATRYVLKQGERLFPWIRRLKLRSFVDKALKGDKNARDVFKRMNDFYFNIEPYRFYLEARVLGRESIDFGTVRTNVLPPMAHRPD